MKHFEYLDYDKCLLARDIEHSINNCGGSSNNLEKVKDILQDNLWPFFRACILYWEEARYDDRNRYAVKLSGKILNQFPQLRRELPEEKILMEAEGFTCYAHRYLQNELFHCILLYLENEKTLGIHEWVESKGFVWDENKELVPYADWKTEKMLNF